MTDPWAGVTPRRWQAEAFDTVLRALRSGKRRVLVHAATGTGKARVIASLAASCKGTTLITAPSQALVRQLSATVAEHCGSDRVGMAYQSAWNLDRDIVVACIPSLSAVLAERPSWSCWLADEAHRIEGPALREVVPGIRARCAVGFTATPFTSCGRGLQTWEELIYSYSSYDATAEGVLVPLRIERAEVAGEVDDLVEAWVSQATGPGIVSAVSVADAEAYAARIGGLAVHGYQSAAEQTRRMQALESGGVNAVVHCQLLVEGADYPWLRWIALRRPVGSPTRLVQEVGRVLRSAPGKRFATCYDPHDCLGSVGLVHGACLEDVQRRAVEAVEPDDWSIPELPGLEPLVGLPRAVAVSALEGWATDALAALRASGVAELPSVDGVNPAGPWRRKAASDKQRAAATRWLGASRHLASPAHRAVVDLLLGAERLRAGVASDVLGILVAVGRRPKAAARVTLPSLKPREPA